MSGPDSSYALRLSYSTLFCHHLNDHDESAMNTQLATRHSPQRNFIQHHNMYYAAVLRRRIYRSDSGPFESPAMQDLVYELPRMPPLGSWVNKGKRKGRGVEAPALAALFSASNCYGVASCTM